MDDPRQLNDSLKSFVYRRNTCRLCESSDVELVLSLTPCPPVDAYVPASRLSEVQEKFPLDLFLCRSCGHAQLLDVVSPKLLFGSYIYTTSSSPGLVNYFASYADSVLCTAKPETGALVIDIGSNDGSLLSFFKARGLRVLGIDPARKIAASATASGIETVPEFFASPLAIKIRALHGPATIVTANNVFAHVDNLGDMAEGIRMLLAPNGIFVFEVSYLLDIVENMVFDFIYHEHLSHHSVKPLLKFLSRHGLEMLSVERTSSKGGSLRCVAQLADGPLKIEASIGELVELETTFGLDQSDIFKDFASKIQHSKEQLERLLTDLKRRGKKIAGYGASATSTVLIYHFNLSGFLDFVADDNPLRQNLFSPGYHIPVLSPKAFYERKADYVLTLAWRFSNMMIKKHQEYLDQGGHFIVPLPRLQLL